jgi:hypothetical protein
MLKRKLENHNKKAFGKTFANLELELVQFKLVIQVL